MEDLGSVRLVDCSSHLDSCCLGHFERSDSFSVREREELVDHRQFRLNDVKPIDAGDSDSVAYAMTFSCPNPLGLSA